MYHLIGAPLEHLLTELAPRKPWLSTRPSRPHWRAYRGAALPQLIWRNGADREFDGYATLAADDSALAVAVDDVIALSAEFGHHGRAKGGAEDRPSICAGPMAVLRLTEAGPGDVFLFWEALHHGSGVAVAMLALIGRFQLAIARAVQLRRASGTTRGGSRATHIHYLGGVLPTPMKQPARADDRQHGVRYSPEAAAVPRTSGPNLPIASGSRCARAMACSN